MSMRTLINLVEAKRPSKTKPMMPAAVDTSAFYARAAALARIFAANPFFEKSDPEWVKKAHALVLERRKERDSDRARHQEDYGDESDYDEEFGPFDVADAMEIAATKIWNYERLSLASVRRAIEDAEDAYQQRAVERAGHSSGSHFADHFGSMIEDSAYLRGMQAQVDLAQTLGGLSADLSGAGIKRMLDAMEQFARTYSVNAEPLDGGEGPVLNEDIIHIIARLPALIMAVTKPTAV